MPRLNTSFCFLLIILVIAAFLRLNHINQPFTDAFSWRQSSTAMIADNYYRTNWNIFYPEVNWTGPGPNYQGREFQTVSYIAALLYTVLEPHDWIGRSISIFFGLWGIFALYQLIRLVWDEWHAVIGAGVMAVLPGSIFIERSFLPGPAMVALVTTSFWLLIIYLNSERRRYLLLAGLIGSWGFCTKITGLIVGLPMAYVWLASLGGKPALNSRKLRALLIFCMLTLVPVVFYYLWARRLAESFPPYHFAGAGNWLWHDGLKAWWDQAFFWPKVSQRLRDWLWMKPVIVLVTLGLLIPRPTREYYPLSTPSRHSRQNSRKIPWVFHVWLLAGLFYYLIGAKELAENPWNLHIMAPPVAALAGHAIIGIAEFFFAVLNKFVSHSPSRPNHRVISFLTPCLFLLIIALMGQKGLKWMYFPYAEESYTLGLALRDVTNPDDLVITLANDLGDPVGIYYSQRRGWVFPPAAPANSWGRLMDDDDENIRLFVGLRKSGADWVGIVNEQMKDIRENHPALLDYIRRTCTLESRSKDWVIYRLLPPAESGKLF
jgi:hypothetical protein